MIELFGAGAEARLLWHLAALARAGLRRHAEGWAIEFVPTHDRLGALAGLSRENVTRALGRLREDGIITTVRRRYVIPEGSPLLDAVFGGEDDI